MKVILFPIAILAGSFAMAQQAPAAKDTVKGNTKEIEAVTLVARKPTVESKVDRTVFNVANSAILAGNTTWDVLRMTPLVSIDNNDDVKAEGQMVTVYINDRKSVFTGKELKEYLKTIPADNLMKIEVITSPSSRYETSGSVINIVLKKRDDEGLKGSISFNNRQSTKNSQYTNFNLNYHKKKFTQTLIGSYNDGTYVQKNQTWDNRYAENKLTQFNLENVMRNESPSLSSTSEFEINDKNNFGLVLEYSQNRNLLSAESDGMTTKDGDPGESFHQIQNNWGFSRNLGTNAFYKYYDKEKNRILDINLGTNYSSNDNDNLIDKQINKQGAITNQQLGSISSNQMRNYYLKIDYTQPFGKTGGTMEVGGKTELNNHVIPNSLYGISIDNGTPEYANLSKNDRFHYEDHLSSLYANYSKTFFEKLETRVGIRYEYIDYKVRQDVAGTERRDSYGTFLPNLLLKYNFSEKFDLSLTYNRSIWRPWYSEFNPFVTPEINGTYSRGNLYLNPNPNDRLYLKFGILKKYFLSARYMHTNQDYWTTYVTENGRTVSLPGNFDGKVEKYYLFANTNQNFLKNKLNVNAGFGWYYINNKDFNEKNKLGAKDYISYWGASANVSYTNLFNKNINLSAWVELANQNNGNSYANNTNVFHNISVTKIFPKTQMELSMQLMNIFKRPYGDNTTYSQDGTFREYSKWDWYGVSLTFVKRFGNQKVKENTKTDVEKNGGGGK
ncbi:outer membrane beta-barrel family protein [Chryseobacterium sp. D764]|uniref:TonB-dependent receptor domain-containing protein n=1 Tax=unclassified Chryseobacterium TaxID=2593645 RepID=UPI000984AE86|nr:MULTISPECIES: TonB-dependent receptor [unclassified Chryseobacterium]QXU50930.1 outer membrane beta-barrel family protein [Chryseobacterium sp. D764]CAD0220152.1 TonB-dependent receptor [Chryseobacterium sp. JV274]